MTTRMNVAWWSLSKHNHLGVSVILENYITEQSCTGCKAAFS